jgi:hypothetical protein
MASLIDLLSVRYAPIQHTLLQYLSPGAIAKLTCTCRALGCLWPTLMACEYNVNLHLRLFFQDPRAFQSAQATSGALIIDGCAQSYFDFFGRSDYEVSKLQLYVEDKHVVPLATHLVSQGYIQYDPYPHRPENNEGYMTFEKRDSEGKRLEIEIEYDEEMAIYKILGLTDNTTCLHFISWNKAYSVFPYETFVKQECHLLEESRWPLDWHLRHIQQEVIASEFGSTRSLPIAKEGPDTTIRRIGDKHTWILSLDIEGVTVPTIPDAILESTTFEVRCLDQPRCSTKDCSVTCLNYQLYYEALIRY